MQRKLLNYFFPLSCHKFWFMNEKKILSKSVTPPSLNFFFSGTLKWKENLAQKAAAAFLRRQQDTTNLQKLVYGSGEILQDLTYLFFGVSWSCENHCLFLSFHRVSDIKCTYIPVHFFTIHCQNATWSDQIQCFMENLNARRWILIRYLNLK